MSLQELKSHPSVHWSSLLQQERTALGEPAIVTTGFHPTRWGWFPWAPEHFQSLVHPDDWTIAGYLIPSPRILAVNRTSHTDEYSVYNYGFLTFRMKPALWREVPNPGYRLGQTVEISKLRSQREPVRVEIEEIYWDQACDKILFVVSHRGKIWGDDLAAHEFIGPNDWNFVG